MILQRNGGHSDRPGTIGNNSKTLYSFIVTPGRTNYIFKRSKMTGEKDLNCFAGFQPSRENVTSPLFNKQKSPRNNNLNLKIDDSADTLCTSFMKNYVEKLKKQRKRQHKKIQSSRNHKQVVEKAYFSASKVDDPKNDVYLAKQMNHIFILQRVPKRGNGLMNTISIVEEDLNQLRHRQKNRNGQGKTSRQRDWQEPAWANKQRIDKLIKQIRNSRNKVNNADQVPSMSEQLQRPASNPKNDLNLPTLAAKSRELRSRLKSKQKKGAPEVNFKILEPWKQDSNPQQFSIQQYDPKQEEV